MTEPKRKRGRPKTDKAGHRRILAVSVPKPLLDQFEHLCKELKIKRSKLVTGMIQEFMLSAKLIPLKSYLEEYEHGNGEQ